MKNIIGENLYHARKYIDLTIEQVANILDVPASYINAIESGIETPNSQMIINFSNLYGISCLDILTEHNFNLSKDKKAIAELIRFKEEKKVGGK